MAAGTARRRNATERASEIRDAAATIALTRGLAAISLRNLAAHCGVTSPLIAHYEPNMETLVATTFSAIAEKEIGEVARHAHTPTEPLDQIRALIEAIADPARDNVGEVWTDAWSLGRRNESLAEAARQSMDSWHALAIGIIRAGQDAGQFAPVNPERAALVLFALVDATSAYQLVNFRSRETREALVRETLDDMLDVQLAPKSS
ncbi:TetR/AcrR family transcriptional regulator [Salinibacterium sp. M195]|uniref:TetR/AcrR family transcriptional regulator n=1 Tax=Salinibacterium sp. M195 TaxID=2583374 RepID=UPI001C626B09|nr:TetR/AcrR family transcriptional regulator [Salinibacterium sp. M195]QYH35257.1 TetR family transcriptional regulator [Salinibacterium sp. M195]